MLPKNIILRQFLYSKPSQKHVDAERKPYTKNIYKAYIYLNEVVYANTCLKRITKDLLDCIFIYKDTAYKIVKINLEQETAERSAWWGILLMIEEYTDAYINKLNQRLKKVREHFAVYADCIEEVGGPQISAKFRKQCANLYLEDLV